MKDLPLLLRVGAYYIPVHQVSNLMRDHGCCGRYSPCEKKIEIDDNMCLSMQWGTLFHELIECMTEIYCIKALEEDHDAINALSEVLHQVMKDNHEELDARELAVTSYGPGEYK
jgi:hypothetical protein